MKNFPVEGVLVVRASSMDDARKVAQAIAEFVLESEPHQTGGDEYRMKGTMRAQPSVRPEQVTEFVTVEEL